MISCVFLKSAPKQAVVQGTEQQLSVELNGGSDGVKRNLEFSILHTYSQIYPQLPIFWILTASAFSNLFLHVPAGCICSSLVGC